MDPILNVRVPAKTKKQLEKLAHATGRSKTFLAVEALHMYLQDQAWQLEDIAQALKEAEAGAFASDAEVEAVFRKYL